MAHQSPPKTFSMWSHNYRIVRDVTRADEALGHIREYAGAHDMDIAKEVFRMAIEKYPEHRWHLLQGARIILDSARPE